MGKLEGRRALVTGAGSGIGLATCRRFVAEGATVVAADVAGLDKAAAIDAARVIPIACDVSDAAAVQDLARQCEARLGGLDIVFNNAGIGRGGKRIHEIALADWDDVVSVNLRGPFLVLKYTLPLLMAAGGGAVINTASTSAFKAVAGNGAYTPTKAAVAQLTAMAAAEYARDGIRVNGIAPGPIDTPIYETIPLAQREAIVKMLPLGRMGTADEVAGLVAFLASDEAGFITGTTYVIDGGRLIG